MSTSKHTPGPWYITTGGRLPGYKARIGDTEQGLGWDLAHVCNNECGEANARLIAAAPELLEALENIIAGCVNPDSAQRAVLVDLAPIRAVIAKAKGQP